MTSSATTPPTGRPLVLVSWDGASEPLAMLHLDTPAQFDWLLFDYSGRQTAGPRELRGLRCTVLSAATECKGELYQALAEHLAEQQQSGAPLPEYVGLIDDDILLGVSDINRALHLARVERLDCFSPTLSLDSVASHRWSLTQPRRMFRPADWVEVMMPFYRGTLFLAGRTCYRGNVSSWGIDRYLMPTLQRLLGCTHTALLDAVIASHRRPVTSGDKTYRNGRTAPEEREAMKALCQRLIAEQHPELATGDWYRRLFVQRRPFGRMQKLTHSLGRRIRDWLESSL